MALYHFRCSDCDEVVSLHHGMEEDHPRVHADCGGQLQRIYQPAKVIFKGGGFYQNDKALYGTTPGDYERE